MEYLENDFAQIEHINQVIYNNLHHDSWDCFDTTHLLKQYPGLGNYNSSNPANSYLTIPSGVKTIRGKTVKSHDGIRYNSFIVNIKKYSVNEDGTNVTYWEYLFEIRNTLWDGKYKITKTTKDSNGEYIEFSKDDLIIEAGYGVDEEDLTEEEKANVESGNILKITVKGTQGRSIRVCFHMTMASSKRYIEVTNLQLLLEGGDEYTHQYDTTNYETGSISLNTGVNNSYCTVSIEPCDKSGNLIEYTKNTTGTWIPYHKLEKIKTDFNMPYGPTSVPGTYYCLMKVTSSKNYIHSPFEKIITVHKVQNEKAVIDWGDDSLYNNIWKGCRHKYRIKFNLENEYGVESSNKDKLIGTPVNITFIKSTGKRIPYTATIQKDNTTNEYYAEATVSYREYYDNYSTLEVELNSEYGFGRIMDQRIIKHPWYIAHNYNEIASQLYYITSDGNYANEDGTPRELGEDYVENEYGTDWIFCDVGEFTVNVPLKIYRNITIASVQGNGQTVFNANNNHIIITDVHEPSATNMVKVNLIGLTFTNAQAAIRSYAGTRLLVDRCCFTNNRNSLKHHRGCSIYMPDDDWSREHHEYWKTEIRSSYFKNNRGNEIQSIGETNITWNLFITTSSEFLQQPEVKVVSVRAGSVTYSNNTSYINTGKRPMVTNHSYAKALAYVDRGCTFNGRGPNQLGGDMTLPLYKDYNNRAYTYSIYYYPYSNVKTEIVCSPRKGYERKATGHGSSYKNWIYYDGYYFVRWEKGRNTGNTYNPWRDEELAIPSNMGIFDKVKEKFIETYDPRLSYSKSFTTTFEKGG